ncbi:TIGR03364 family FAD-dependent oxidoreductase [bacterium]|nr:TIGR03364 family FAD-dependent oxidoreductase [bacterium]
MAYDLAIVGAGILGLAHALAATRRGLKVIVVDREEHAIGASVRNFGFVTVTGQQAGACYARAMRSRDVWAEVAPRAGIAIEHQGLLVVAQRPEAMACLEAFARTDMGQGCTLMSATETSAQHGAILSGNPIQGALWSPHDRRVESRFAIAKLAAWIESLGVTFLRKTLVKEVQKGRLLTTSGPVEAAQVVVCPGDDMLTLYPEIIARHRITRCRLHMMKVMPARPITLPGSIMSDQSLVRYLGYSELPESEPIKARLRAEQPRTLAEGIHLIVVQGSDGGLIVGDSHHYEWSPSPFQRAEVDDLIMEELHAVLNVPGAQITERWNGTYASGPETMMRETVDDQTCLVIVTSGTGASTSFAIGEETIDEIYGRA